MRLFLLISLAMLLFGIQKSDNQPIDFISSLEQKKINYSAQSNGHYSGESILLTVQNLTQKPLTIQIKAGTLFDPASSDEQTLVTPEDVLVLLSPASKKKINLQGFCTEASDKCPTSLSSFTARRGENEKLNNLFSYAHQKHLGQTYWQDAIWSITDNFPVSHLPNTTEQDKALRKYLCNLTGQQETWYTSPQNRVVLPDRTIRRETVKVDGELAISVKKPCSFRQEVSDSLGQIKMKSPRYIPLQPGDIKFRFHVEVKGWKMGTYTVRLKTEDGETLEQYEFKV